ncbi:MAG: flippase-like domain-containing protein [Acidobacteria bacterium]|nr:flippase-like domain-containing protein [Acidobacteriota bacterium]
MTKRTLRVVISLALMVALLAFFLWNVDFGKVAEALEDSHPLWLLIATALALLSYWLRAVRWAFILRPVGKVRHSSVVLTTAVGYAAMTLLPARMGDIVRPVLLARRDNLPVSATLASILTERLFDLWTVVFFFLLFVLNPPAMTLRGEARSYLHTLTTSGWVIAAGLVVGSLVLLGLFRYQERFVQLLAWPVGRFLPRWKGPVSRFFDHFLNGLRVLQRPRDLLITVGASLLMWWVIYWQVWATLIAFDIHLPLRAAYLIVTLAVIGLAIPTPGGVGGFHKAAQIGLTSFFGIELNEATGIAIAYHAICFLPITIIGLACLPVLGLSLRETSHIADQGLPATEE